MGDFCDSLLLVGLGNPGNQYAYSRHNTGFMVADAIAEVASSQTAARSVFFKKVSPLAEIAAFAIEKSGSGSASNSTATEKSRVVLAKPLTFMNLSGRAVRFLMDFYKLKLENIYVFHDDIDLEFGRVKIKKGGGNGGHNGLRSIDDLAGRDYWRVRIGVGRPEGRGDVASYVLHKFKEDEIIYIQQIAQKISENLKLLWNDPKKLEQKLNEK